MKFDREEIQEAAYDYIRKYGTEEGICESNPLMPLKTDTPYWEYKNAKNDEGFYLHPEFRKKIEDALDLSYNRLQVIQDSNLQFIEHQSALDAIKDEIQRGEYNQMFRQSWKETKMIEGKEKEVTIIEEERRRSPRLPLLLKTLDNALPTERSLTMFIVDINQAILQSGLFDEHDTDRILNFTDQYFKQRMKTIRLHRKV